MLNKLIKIEQVEEITALSRSSIYRQIAAGTFPKQVKISERASAWRAEEVQQWVTDLQPANDSNIEQVNSHSTITKLNLNLMRYRSAIELADVELRAAVVANQADYEEMRSMLAVDKEICARLESDAKAYNEKVTPIFIRLCKVIDEVSE
jgi:prophage regulatory protein